MLNYSLIIKYHFILFVIVQKASFSFPVHAHDEHGESVFVDVRAQQLHCVRRRQCRLALQSQLGARRLSQQNQHQIRR